MTGSWGTNSTSINWNNGGSGWILGKIFSMWGEPSSGARAWKDWAISSLEGYNGHSPEQSYMMSKPTLLWAGDQTLVHSNLSYPLILKTQNTGNPQTHIPKEPVTSLCAISILLFTLYLFAVLTRHHFYMQENAKLFARFTFLRHFLFVCFRGCSDAWK